MKHIRSVRWVQSNRKSGAMLVPRASHEARNAGSSLRFDEAAYIPAHPVSLQQSNVSRCLEFHFWVKSSLLPLQTGRAGPERWAAHSTRETFGGLGELGS